MLTEQSEPSLGSAAICRQDYLLVHSANKQSQLGLIGLGGQFLIKLHVSHLVCCLQIHRSQFSATMTSPSILYSDIRFWFYGMNRLEILVADIHNYSDLVVLLHKTVWYKTLSHRIVFLFHFGWKSLFMTQTFLRSN